MIAKPYVYKLIHKESKEFYFGVRWGNKYPAELDLGKRYKTSSKIVKPRFDEFYIDSITEFTDNEAAIDHEQRLIESHWGDPLLLNKAIQVSKKFRCQGHTQETRQKMSDSKKGKAPNNKGKSLSEETKQKISKAQIGKKHSEETKERIRLKAIGNQRGVGNKSRTGQKQSKEERLKKSIALSGEKNPFYGKRHSEESKEKLRAALKNRPKIQCPHCSKNLDPANYGKSHGDKCKSRIDSQ